MKIEISVFATIAMLFVLHTVLTHLFNWWFRQFDNREAIICWLALAEIVVLLFTLDNLMS